MLEEASRGGTDVLIKGVVRQVTRLAPSEMTRV
jgi:hypothetical protein